MGCGDHRFAERHGFYQRVRKPLLDTALFFAAGQAEHVTGAIHGLQSVSAQRAEKGNLRVHAQPGCHAPHVNRDLRALPTDHPHLEVVLRQLLDGFEQHFMALALHKKGHNQHHEFLFGPVVLDINAVPYYLGL